MAESQTVHEAILKLRADSAQLRSDLATGKNILQGGLNEFQGMMRKAAAVLGIGFGGAQLISFFRSSIDELSKQEAAQASLEATLRSTGQASREYTNFLLQQAAALQQVTTHGDDAILGVQQQLIAFGASGQQLEKLTELTLDLADGMGIDLAGAARLMGRAIAGNFATLSRYGITVDESASKSEKLEQALRQIEERFGGQARAKADTFTGSIKQMSNAWGEMKEAIAQVVAENQTFFNAIRGFTDFLLQPMSRRIAVANAELADLEAAFAKVSGLSSREIFTAPDLSALVKDRPALFAQAENIKRIREELKQLKEAAAEATKPPASATGKAVVIDPDDLKKAGDRVTSFLEGLQKQIEQGQAKLKEGLSGEGSALADGLDAEFARLKRNLAADNLPIPVGLEQSYQKLRAGILNVNDQLRSQKLLLEQFTGADIEDAAFGQALRDRIDEERKLNIEIAERVRLLQLEALFGANDAIDAERGAEIRDQQQRSQDLGKTLWHLNERQYDAQQLSIALGNSFDLTSDKIAIQRQRVEELVKAYGALSPEVTDAVAELRRLENQQAGQELFRGLADSIDHGLSDTLRGINEGSQTLGEGMRNLARNVIISFGEEFNKRALINPIKNWLLDLTGDTGPREKVLNLGALRGFGSRGQQRPNIQNFPNVAAPAAAVEFPIDISEWTITAAEGFNALDNTVLQGLQSLNVTSNTGFVQLFQGLGETISEGIGSLLEGISGDGGFDFSSIISGIGGLFGGSFDSGGVVPGPIGAPRMVMAHGGETFLPTHKGFALEMPELVSMAAPMSVAPGEISADGMDKIGLELDFKNMQVIPRAPWASLKDIVTVTAKSLKDRTEVYNAVRDWGPKRNA